METAQHWDRLAKNQPAEIAMFQISEVQEAPAFNGRRSFLTLRVSQLLALSTEFYAVLLAVAARKTVWRLTDTSRTTVATERARELPEKSWMSDLVITSRNYRLCRSCARKAISAFQEV